MRDMWRNYDQWKLMSREDEEDERAKRREIDEALADRADYDRDRMKDEEFE